ncbi:beta-phosphoglucomutase [Enterococcus hulanensis]|uniref:beta-phosphoglucomutase n=1 Tax=Enterococcus TaxID=1350 RepID=UPI000B5A26E1|nr:MULTISPECIES: beta-phosphoglucomutase [Enterococcus]MBO0413529.1 beta-phosphoglucomutase [Enterococcus hulanensis]OTO15403.1 beta-phosphoglucomutase [Enterococcus sp. 3H8_DIV0648]
MQGFVFDLDGVLADTAKYHYIAWKQLAAEIGITIDEVFNEQLKGISRQESLERILAHGGKCSTFSTDELAKMAEKKNQHYVELLEELTSEDALPGVRELLAAAREHNIPCTVASASKNAPLILEKLVLADYFVGIVDPESLAKGKPDPEIFIKAAQLMSLDPKEVIGFEDAQAGIDGIKGCGMYAIGIGEAEQLKDADRVITDLTEIAIEELLRI